MTPNRSSIRPISALLLAILSMLRCIPCTCLAQDHDSAPKSGISLQAGALSVSVDVSGKHFAGLHIHDGISDRTIDMDEAFVLVLKDKSLLRSTNMQVTAISNSIVASDGKSADFQRGCGQRL